MDRYTSVGGEEFYYSIKISLLRVAPSAVFLRPQDMDILIERQGGSYKFGEDVVAHSRLIDAVYEELSKAVGSASIIVLKGGWGIGKTVATHVALRRLLEESQQSGRRIVISVAFNGRKNLAFLKKAGDLGYDPVLYLSYSNNYSYSYGRYRAHLTFHQMRELSFRLADAVAYARRGTAVIVLSNDQYSALYGLLRKVGGRYVKTIDADEVLKSEKQAFVRGLVKANCGCSDEVAERVASAAVEQFEDGYAVMAALAGRLIRDGMPVEDAIREARRRTVKYALDYIWSCIYGDRDGKLVFYHHAPLIMAKGLLGPHFPQSLTPDVADEIARSAFGSGSTAVDEDALRWLDSLRPGTALYEAIRGAAYGAVYRRFRVGNDEICRGSSSYSCYMVEGLEEILYGLRHKNYRNVEEVARDYAKYLVSKAQRTAGRGLGLA